MDKELKAALRNALYTNTYMDFLSDRGHEFTKDELVALLKEALYSAEIMSQHLDNYDFADYKTLLMDNIKEHTNLDD